MIAPPAFILIEGRCKLHKQGTSAVTGMTGAQVCEQTIWMLGRIWNGHVQLRENGADLPRVGSYWEPGAVWMNGDDLKALHFAAFMVGVT